MRFLTLLALSPAAAIVTDVVGTPHEEPTVVSSASANVAVSLTLARHLYVAPDGLQQWTRAFNGELTGPTIRVSTRRASRTGDLWSMSRIP